LEKAAALAAATGARAAAWDETHRAFDYDVVLNATTLGQEGIHDASFPYQSIRAGQLVMDIVYKPLQTPLLAAARARGAIAVHGGRMLLHQAAAQFELYTAHPAPREAMDEALRAAIGTVG
jgi:shikimate dehydrogenase